MVNEWIGIAFDLAACVVLAIVWVRYRAMRDELDSLHAYLTEQAARQGRDSGIDMTTL